MVGSKIVHVIIPMDTEKAFDKNLPSFMINTQQTRKRRIAFLANDIGKNWISTCKKKKSAWALGVWLKW
jgi:hypothetical protein